MQKINLLFSAVILLFSISNLRGQGGFSDDFSDGDFSMNPVWQGQTNKFIVNDSNELQLSDSNASSSNSSFLATNSTVINNASWEFYVKLNFNPSSSNFARVFLVSDNQDLTQNLNGYFVQIGGQSGTIDDVSLYRKDGSQEVEIIDGIDGTVATSPEVKIRITKDSLNKWEVFVDQTASGINYVSNGIVTDSTYTNSSFFGVYCKYTSTRFDKFFFDDFVVNGASFQDTVRPRINTLTVINDRELLLSFSELLESNSAENTANYLVNLSIGNPSTAQFDANDSSKIRLSFSTPFTNGTEYSLISQGINDKSGNTLLTDTTAFLYFVPERASYRDVVINELYPDFTPSNGLPAGEFIELFNTSNKFIELNNWTISDGSSGGSILTHILRPGEYLILCASSMFSAYQSFGPTQGIQSFPSLNNNGDRITLLDDSMQLIDEVEYSLSWYGDDNKNSGGYSLEQINPFTNCIGSNNFVASNHSVGGTPGQENSVFDTIPDNIPPQLLNAIVISADSILLEFDEFLDSNSVLNANYTFSTSVTIGQVLNQPPSYQSILLVLSNPLDSGVVNTITISMLTDCSGNSIGAQNSVDIVVPGVPNHRDVVINELFADFSPSVGLPEAEFIELFNASNKIFDLQDWTISDGTTITTLSSLIFRPGDYIVICEKGNELAFQNFGPTQANDAFPSLNNSGDLIRLFDKANSLIDFVNYKDSWYQDEIKDDGGYTLEQINPFAPCNGANNFIASNSSNGGTPGQVNSVFDSSVDIQAPTLVNTFVISSDTLLLVFDEGLDSVSTGSANYSFSDSNSIVSVDNIAPDYTSFYLILTNPLDSGELVSMTVTDIADCSGNIISPTSAQIALPQSANSNDIIINEILFNPRTGGVDFVEIYNRSTRVISLEGWSIANENGILNDKKLITDQAYLLFPKEYLVLTENPSNILHEYPLGVTNRIFKINDLPSYNDDEGVVYIFDQNENQADRVAYDEDQHFALLADEEGVSLERISPDRPSHERDNFHSASEKVGFATPGYQNSQFFASSSFSGTITIDPKTFSPDNDGFQDVVNINYQFTSPGYVANVDIFDRNGRKIKSLIKNELLGGHGTFSWDGTSDDNTKARIGIYVVLVEAFHPNGDKEVFKEVVVVAGFID